MRCREREFREITKVAVAIPQLVCWVVRDSDDDELGLGFWIGENLADSEVRAIDGHRTPEVREPYGSAKPPRSATSGHTNGGFPERGIKPSGRFH
jgi:hypothetical protein